MKKFKLNHEYTPKKLADINSQLEAILRSEELDDSKLRTLIEDRDQFVVSHLNSLNTKQQKSFAESEMTSNNALSEIVGKKLSNSLKQLSGLLRGRKAVDKYK